MYRSLKLFTMTIGHALSINCLANAAYAYSRDGQRFYLSQSARRTIQLFYEIASAKPTQHCWLLKYRPQIREIQRRKCTTILSRIAEASTDPKVQLLAIWLLGRCRRSAGTKQIAPYMRSRDRQMRKELVRAFRRMSAWTELRAMIRNESDSRILRMAMHIRVPPFADRLVKFTSSVDQRNEPDRSSAPQPLLIQPGVSCENGLPAKSRTLIRVILERIHRLVSFRNRR